MRLLPSGTPASVSEGMVAAPINTAKSDAIIRAVMNLGRSLLRSASQAPSVSGVYKAAYEFDRGGTAPTPVENPTDPVLLFAKADATPDIYFKGARIMNTLVYLSAAAHPLHSQLFRRAGASTVAPSAATLNATYVGRTLFVNGRPVTAARLNPLPRYAELVPDKSRSKNYEYIFNDYGSYGSIFNYPKSTSDDR